MRLQETLGKKYVTGINCEFYIELQLNFPGDELELEQLQKMCQDEYANRAKNHKKYHMGLVTRVGAEKSLESVSENKFKLHYQVPPEQPQDSLLWEVVLKHDSCFVAGRYNKFSRELPQTPWILDGKRVFETSVEELITNEMKKQLTIDGKISSDNGA